MAPDTVPGQARGQPARVFGFERVGSVVAERIEKAIHALVARGTVTSDGETIALATTR